MLELKGMVRTMWSSGGDLIQLYANKEVGSSMSAYIYPRTQKKCVRSPSNISDMGAQRGPKVLICGRHLADVAAIRYAS